MLSIDDFSAVATRFPSLRGAAGALREDVLRSAAAFLSPVGNLVFAPGQRCDRMLLLTRGCLRVSLAPQRATTIYRVHGGETCILSTAALLSGTPLQIAAVVEADAAGVAIPEVLFNRLIVELAEFRRFVFSMFAARMVEVLQQMRDLAGRTLEERLASLLITAPQPLERTHQDLADELGTAREVVSRLLGAFSNRKLVRLARRRIWVLDANALQRVVAPNGQVAMVAGFARPS